MRQRHLPRLCQSCRGVSAGRIDLDRWAGEAGRLISEARATTNRR